MVMCSIWFTKTKANTTRIVASSSAIGLDVGLDKFGQGFGNEFDNRTIGNRKNILALPSKGAIVP